MTQPLLHDEFFTAPAQPIDARDVFALDDAMRSYLRDNGKGALFFHNRAEWLVQALYKRGELKIEYDAAATRNAAQAFDARAGNCLSLVLMTAALAKELGLQVEYNSAFTEETWSRQGALLLRSGHINITLGKRMIDRPRGQDSRVWTIDFLPAGELQGLRVKPIEEATVVAMFMNNRAAEALARDEAEQAYWWARAGMLADPGFTGVVNTLGVVYQRSGHADAAVQVFRELLRSQPNHTQALNNLALLLEQQGRGAEAAPLRARWPRSSRSRRTTGSCKGRRRCGAAMRAPHATFLRARWPAPTTPASSTTGSRSRTSSSASSRPRSTISSVRKR
jgi:tetratricopeptide (TPR) repeat protein